MPRQVTDIELRNTVSFKSHLYATLDFQPPGLNESVQGTPGAKLELPTGWELAPSETEIIAEVVGKHGWGTAALVLSNFAGYSTAWNRQAGIGNGEGLFAFQSQGNLYCVERGKRRLLIRTPCPWGLSGGCAQGYCAEVLSGLGKRRKFTDCTVGCGNEVIACHRSVLAESSPVFERMLESEMAEGAERHIELPDAKPQVVTAMVDFIYSGRVVIDKDDMPDLLLLADCYQLTALMLAAATQALQVVDTKSVGKLARSFRPLAGTPQGQAVFRAFLDLLKHDEELLQAAITDM